MITSISLIVLFSQVMRDPVSDAEGNTYERAAIIEWLASHATSPITRSPLSADELVPNRALREAIEQSNPIEHSNPISHTIPVPEANPFVASTAMEVEVTEPIKLALTTKAEGDEVLVMATAVVPESSRARLDVCLCIDVSGSMGSEASIQNEKGETESHGLSLLDIVKHAGKSVIKTLSPSDRLSIVAYSSGASQVLALTPMNASGTATAERALSSLHPSGGTNLWDGLKMGLETLGEESQRAQRPTAVSALLILTDGMPNINPPRGILPMLQRAKDNMGGLPCSINTFGFGYNLDSQLLHDLAEEGAGTYSFIPDSGFVGTAFVNSTANLLSTIATHASLSLSIEASPLQTLTLNEAVTSGKMTLTSWGGVFELGALLAGQSRSMLAKVTSSTSGAVLGIGEIKAAVSGTLTLIDRQGNRQTITGEWDTDATSVDIEHARLTCATAIGEATRLFSSCRPGEGKEAAQSYINQIIAAMTALPNSLNIPFIQALLEDMEGQVTQALSRSDWMQRWGKHYLPSLMRCHLLQQCGNFKDPGIQLYGGSLFKTIRDAADDIFCSLAPPEPSLRGRGGGYGGRRSSRAGAGAGAVSMRSYNNRSNPCFAGSSKVEMGDGSTREAEHIMKGDTVLSPGSSVGSSQIRCVVKTLCEDGVCDLVQLGAMAVTPYHPIRERSTGDNDDFDFPINVGKVQEQQCPAVYSFVLEEGGIMRIGGFDCVTLGHGLSGPVSAHEYFGTHKVLQDLSAMDGWDDGLIVLQPGCAQRDLATGHVCRLIQNSNSNRTAYITLKCGCKYGYGSECRCAKK
ncbi:unnamed protein product [Chrysoparadoxa australica]